MPSPRTTISRRLRQSLNHTEVHVGLHTRASDRVGPAHDDEAQWARDQQRYAWLESHGYRVVQIRVHEIDADIAEVLDRIAADSFSARISDLNVLGETAPPAPPPPDGGSSPLRGEDYICSGPSAA